MEMDIEICPPNEITKTAERFGEIFNDSSVFIGGPFVNMADHREFGNDKSDPEFPTTRYSGSKRTISDWIWSEIGNKSIDSFLDAFCGTCSVGFEAKRHGKKVVVNDLLEFNYQIGKSIIKNRDVTLNEGDIEYVLSAHNNIDYPTTIQDEFEGKYYKNDENEWLDKVVTNIRHLDNEFKIATAYSALGQACLMKRPFNMFHRANLNMRTRDVDRSFGNKTTWEKPFPVLFRKSVREFNNAVFDNGRQNESLNQNVFDLDVNVDLAYFDPPYLSKRNGGTDYKYYYHFLEGMLNYEIWKEQINREVKTYRLQHEKSVWNNKSEIHDAFKKLFAKFQDSRLVLSYNTQGVPSIDELMNMMSRFKSEVSVVKRDYQYALSKDNGIEEVLIIGSE